MGAPSVVGMMPLDSGFFDSIAGLPLHPLVVHFAVVLLPLAALVLVLLVGVPKWADRYAAVTLGVLGLGTGAALLAKQSGEALAEKMGEPTSHASWGDLLPLIAVGLLVLGIAWYVLRRRDQRGGGRSLTTTVVSALVAVLALVVTGVTVVVGHTGAQAAWGGTVDAAAPAPMQASPGAGASVSSSSSSSITSTTPSVSPSKAAGTYTLADVAKHAGASSCWSAIGGKIYDLTPWISQHPGGQRAILGLCGKDGTAAFDAQHGGQSRPASELRQFLIGTLA